MIPRQYGGGTFLSRLCSNEFISVARAPVPSIRQFFQTAELLQRKAGDTAATQPGKTKVSTTGIRNAVIPRFPGFR